MLLAKYPVTRVAVNLTYLRMVCAIRLVTEISNVTIKLSHPPPTTGSVSLWFLLNMYFFYFIPSFHRIKNDNSSIDLIIFTINI